ncbi:hypothetical protein D9M71_763040 [compost metagenome]
MRPGLFKITPAGLHFRQADQCVQDIGVSAFGAVLQGPAQRVFAGVQVATQQVQLALQQAQTAQQQAVPTTEPRDQLQTFQ